jgi:ribonuclease G
MSKQILVNSNHYETRVALLEDGEIKQLHIEREEDKNVVGNVYLGVVKRVLPGMQAAFLELGLERTAFLYVDDIIDEPFGSDVDVLDEDESSEEGSGQNYYEDEEGQQNTPREAKEPRESEAGLETGASENDQPEENEALIFEEDNSAAPIFVAPQIAEDDSSEEEEDQEDEDEEDEDFEEAVDRPENEPDFELTDNETEAAETIEVQAEASTEIASEPVASEEPIAKDLPAFEPMPEEIRQKDLLTETSPAPEHLEEEGPQPGNERSPSDSGAPRSRERHSGPRRRDFRDNRRGRGGHRNDRYGRGQDRGDRYGNRNDRQDYREDRPARNDRQDYREDRPARNDRQDYREDRPARNDRQDYREDRPARNDRQDYREDRPARNDRQDYREDRPARNDRQDYREDRPARNDRQSNREGSREGRGPRRNNRRYEAREGRSSRQRPRYGNRNNRRRGFSRRRRGTANIQDLLKEGQEILVQVAKAPIGTKGARLTTHISLPGRNLVLMPTVKHLGISRRIQSDRERGRLRDIFTKRLRVKGVGFIIRTVAEGKTFRELKADADYLIRTWQQIKRDSSQKRAPALIHEDLSLTYRTVRDFFTEEVDSLVIDNTEDHDGIQNFIGEFMPQLKSRVKLFKGPSQLFEHYGIEAEISRALSKKVWLKSGGYLLIDQSEALTAIDVNTGRYVGSKSLEETILRTNLEAVKEIAYQLRIRNVGGIIIIDLIDMESAQNREKVFNALQDALSGDKSKTNILKISELGLVEMTRKRTHEDLIRYLTESCPSCDGRGYTKSRRTVAFEIFREIEKEAISNTHNIVVFASPGVVSLLAKEESRHVGLLEKRFGKSIIIKPDAAFHTEQFEVFGKH